jgi:hypothetical protein
MSYHVGPVEVTSPLFETKKYLVADGVAKRVDIVKTERASRFLTIHCLEQEEQACLLHSVPQQQPYFFPWFFIIKIV